MDTAVTGRAAVATRLNAPLAAPPRCLDSALMTLGASVAESVTITDNRTGESIEIPIVNGGVDAGEWSKLLPGIWFYDPAFTHDGGRHELHHRARRRGRHPALPRLPDRAAGRAVDLPRGGLPAASTASSPPPSSTRRGSTTSRTTRSSTRTCASASWRASTTTPTPWACSSRRSPRCRPSTRRPRTSTTRTVRYKQIIRLIAKMPTHRRRRPPPQRRHAVRLPGQQPRLPARTSCR